MIKMTKIKIYILLSLLTSVAVFGQQKQVQASIDSTSIKIGSQFNLTLKTVVDTTAKVNFPEGKTFGLLEVLESYPVDTVRKDARYELVKKYGLTQFDTGRYIIPPLPVVINNQNIQTDSLVIEVAGVEVDTVKQQMFDIKPVATADKPGNNLWLYIVIGILAAAAIAFGIWWYLKKYKRKPKAVKEEPVYTSPIEKATTQLKLLEKKALLEKGAVKDYYSELTDIARTYIEEAIHIPAMESTTSELIEGMRIAVLRKKMSLSQETFEQLEKVLRTADMVKFAKSKPLDFEIAEDRNRIEKTIVVIDKSIPVEPDEEEDDEGQAQLWLEMQRKKKRRKKINTIIGIAAFVVLFAVVFIASTVGFSYLKDNIIGHPVKELLEGEWVTSEYGEPPIKLETPKVLVRVKDEAQQHMPEHVKAYSKFAYGSLTDSFFIVASSTAFKEPIQVDAENVINNELAAYEKEYGAKDIFLKTEEFSNEGGMNGKRAYGTMTIKNPATENVEKLYYNIMVFVRQDAAHEVIIFHKDGDKDAEKIAERIMNSIAFVQVSK